MYKQLLGRYIYGYPSSDIKTSTNHCPMAHSTGTRRIKQILRSLHLRIYLVHIINNFANLGYWFHLFIFACILEQGQKMKITTIYCYFIYTVMKVLLNIYIHCSVVHSYEISCSTSSSSYSSSLSAYSFWQSAEHRQRSVQTSPAF